MHAALVTSVIYNSNETRMQIVYWLNLSVFQITLGARWCRKLGVSFRSGVLASIKSFVGLRDGKECPADVGSNQTKLNVCAPRFSQTLPTSTSDGAVVETFYQKRCGDGPAVFLRMS